jgi:hypothetical protein
MPARLRDYFRKPSGRAGRHPHYLEIVVARTGRPAHTFRINLDTLKRVGQGLGVLFLAWFGGTFYVAYSHISNMEAIARADQQAEKIALLESSNEKLAEEKQNMGQYVFSLRERVENLAASVHGMVNRAEAEYPMEASRPKGGAAIPLTAANASQIMRSELSSLDDRLDSLLPKLESSLMREISRPVGIPIAGMMDISSRYGLRSNPFGKGHEFHNGIDFIVDPGRRYWRQRPARLNRRATTDLTAIVSPSTTALAIAACTRIFPRSASSRETRSSAARLWAFPATPDVPADRICITPCITAGKRSIPRAM